MAGEDRGAVRANPFSSFDYVSTYWSTQRVAWQARTAERSEPILCTLIKETLCAAFFFLLKKVDSPTLDQQNFSRKQKKWASEKYPEIDD